MESTRKKVLSLAVIGVLGCLSSVKAESHNVPFADESFRRLESGENSDEVINQCCKRESHFVTVGYGLNDNEIRVDVGKCRQTCEHSGSPLKPLKRDEFDRYLKKYPDMDPVQIFLALQSRVSPSSSSSSSDEVPPPTASSTSGTLASMGNQGSSCLASSCQPSSYRRERVYLPSIGSYEEVDAIESCDCLREPQSCRRTSKPLRIHPDTPFERVIDVGQCGGHCGDDESSCKPIRNKTVSLEGPNGQSCFESVAECGCAGECFRVREFLKVFDYVNIFAARGNRSEGSRSDEDLGHNETRTDLLIERNEVDLMPSSRGSRAEGPHQIVDEDEEIEPLTKVIDIGRCGGSCSGASVTSKCLSWENGTCLSSLYGGRSRCFPKKFLTHEYTDRKGHVHQVLSVLSCACH